MTDTWQWHVTYSDGATLDEYDEEGHDHGFAEIDLSHVIGFELRSATHPWHMLALDPAQQRLIFYRVRNHVMPLGVEGSTILVTATVLGWQTTHKGENIAHFTAFFDNGASFMTTDRAALEAMIHQVASAAA